MIQTASNRRRRGQRDRCILEQIVEVRTRQAPKLQDVAEAAWVNQIRAALSLNERIWSRRWSRAKQVRPRRGLHRSGSFADVSACSTPSARSSGLGYPSSLSHNGFFTTQLESSLHGQRGSNRPLALWRHGTRASLRFRRSRSWLVPPLDSGLCATLQTIAALLLLATRSHAALKINYVP